MLALAFFSPGAGRSNTGAFACVNARRRRDARLGRGALAQTNEAQRLACGNASLDALSAVMTVTYTLGVARRERVTRDGGSRRQMVIQGD